MFSSLRLLIITFLLSFAIPFSVANETTNADALNAQKELLQQKIDSNRELAQKDIDALKAHIDAFDKRIDDQNNRVGDIGAGVDRFAVVAGVLGLLVTVVLFLGGWAAYLSVARKAAEEANSSSKKWFDDNAEELKARIVQLERSAEQAHKTIEDRVAGVAERSEAANVTIIAAMQKSMNASAEQAQSISPEDADALRTSEEQLRNTPEANYSFEDWNQRAFAAYSENNLEAAALFWKQASEVPNAGVIKTVQVLLNRGLVLGQMQKPSEAIAIYQHLIDNYATDITPAIRELVAMAMVHKGNAFGKMQKLYEAIDCYQQVINNNAADMTPTIREIVVGATLNKGLIFVQMQKPDEALATNQRIIDNYESDLSPVIREQVAKAMNNKGFTLRQMQKPYEEIASYQLVIDHYGSDSTPAIREQVARAMVNKGIALGQMKKSDEEFATYLHVIDQYSTDTTPAIREQVGRAFNSIGFALLIKAKKDWFNKGEAHALLSDAKNKLLQALDLCSDCGMTRGNLAYVQWLLGDAKAAEAEFRTALTASQNGGEALYKGTLADFDLYPLEEDKGFRDIVERLWKEYSQTVKPPIES